MTVIWNHVFLVIWIALFSLSAFEIINLSISVQECKDREYPKARRSILSMAEVSTLVKYNCSEKTETIVILLQAVESWHTWNCTF